MIFKVSLILCAAFFLATPQAPAVMLSDLRCEYRTNSLGVDTQHPRLSWVINSDERGVRQTAYKIVVAESPDKLDRDGQSIWDSGKVLSDASNQVEYAGPALASTQQVYWKVRVWDGQDKPSEWSEPQTWTMGVVSPADWQCKWITTNIITQDLLRLTWLRDAKWLWAPGFDAQVMAPVHTVRFRRTVTVPADRTIREATFLLTADNVFHLRVNGKPVAEGTEWENPVAVDIAEHLKIGENLLEIDATNIAHGPAGLIGALNIEFTRGQPIRIVTDSTWEVIKRGGAVVAANEIAHYGEMPWGCRTGWEEPRMPIFRREFNVPKQVKRAVVHISGLGHYELRLNGGKVGDYVIDPGWTGYGKSRLYTTYDVTDLLQQGGNAIGVVLGNGFYNVVVGRYYRVLGSWGPPELLLQMEIEYADGTTGRVASDSSWRTALGPITFTSIFGGEDYDARLEQPGWDKPGFKPRRKWASVRVTDSPDAKLKSQMNEPVIVQSVIRPVSRVDNPDGPLYDLGQNFSGWVRLRVKGSAGAQVRITPGERLRDGLIDQSESGGPSYWQYTLKGQGVEEWAPQFTYYGFRWVQVEGASAEGDPSKTAVIEDIQGELIYPDVRRVGKFECSDDLLNKIHTLIDWAVVSNLKSVLTDCPHREKLGWLEEYHLMGPSIMYNHELAALQSKLVRDMADAQYKSGRVPTTAPEYVPLGPPFDDAPEWGSAYIIVPWQTYLTYGDVRILRENYEGMKRYVAYLGTMSTDNILDYGLGDWADVGPHMPYASLTPPSVTSTAIYRYNAKVMMEAAKLLGKTDDVEHYARLADDIKAAFNREFFNAETNHYHEGSQTSNALALWMGIAEQERVPAVLENLVRDVKDRGYHTTAGDVGHRFVLQTLADHGRSDVVLKMAQQTDHPSYGYQIKHGATALTEAWDGPTRGWSQNHFMIGHIQEWFHRSLLGIDQAPGSAGFKNIVIRPQIVGDLEWAKGGYMSLYGWIGSEWRKTGDSVTLQVTIPANTTATVWVPTADASRITEGSTPAAEAEGVEYLRVRDGAAVYTVGSGSYVFTSPL